jgi:tetratricopeptide (TPR) repeat protein
MGKKKRNTAVINIVLWFLIFNLAMAKLVLGSEENLLGGKKSSKSQVKEELEKEFGEWIENLAEANLNLRKELDELKNKFEAYKENVKEEKALLYFQLGLAYLKARLYDEAIDAYQKSILFDPNNSEVNYHLGLLYQYVEGDSEKAVYYLEKYLALKPDAKNRRRVKELIDILKE